MADCSYHALFTSKTSVAKVIERLLQEACLSIDAALYRIDNPRLAQALGEAHGRGVRVRLLVDRGKYEEVQSMRKLLAAAHIPVRPIYGRKGKGSRLHHKFAILDGNAVLTGSYNWTIESEIENYDHLTILRDPALITDYQQEFDQLWQFAPEAALS
jgi:mitochondrial cardiolipin hydrolase